MVGICTPDASYPVTESQSPRPCPGSEVKYQVKCCICPAVMGLRHPYSQHFRRLPKDAMHAQAVGLRLIAARTTSASRQLWDSRGATCTTWAAKSLLFVAALPAPQPTPTRLPTRLRWHGKSREFTLSIHAFPGFPPARPLRRTCCNRR